jgi:tetratricopeptide (TPR) repeat protein
VKTDDIKDRYAVRSRVWLSILAVAMVALIMGIPTVKGGFVGGDDRQLVLNHVLVNHPSLAHGFKLFTILHRDLYQPLPLVSFSIEFAIAGRAGLLDRGIEGAAWLFHLSNVLLHALNAALVFIVIRKWMTLAADRGALSDVRHKSGEYAIPLIAAWIFACHPLQVEVVAWLNGRMMLLSTTFALVSTWALALWFTNGRHRWMAVTLAAVLLCGISKVRVGLPFVLILLPLALGLWRPRAAHGGQVAETPNDGDSRRPSTMGTLVLWLGTLVITGVLAVVNIRATAQAGMFQGVAENFQGPRIARVMLSLKWYLQHYIWPSDLAPVYPGPLTIQWTDGPVLVALLVVCLSAVVVIWMAVRHRIALVGFGWFLLTIGSTLPIVPARNTIAADRYMYLPIIGLAWVTGLALEQAWRRWLGGSSAVASRLTVFAIGGTATIAMILTSWHISATYETYLAKAMRVAEIFPDTPHVWERVGWSYYSLGDYEKAIDHAQKEFVHEDNAVLLSDVYGLIGLSRIKLGQLDAGIADLRTGTATTPTRAMPRHRLACALDDHGKTDEAVAIWEKLTGELANFNPAWLRLAAANRSLGRDEKARRCYQHALGNNPYDVQATLGLAETDIQAGTEQSLLDAENRLRMLLSWMPENTVALTNLGVVLINTGRVAEGIEAYRSVLATDPGNLTAAVNLGRVLIRQGRPAEALDWLDGIQTHLETMEQVLVVSDLYLEAGATRNAVFLWESFVSSHPRQADVAHAFRTWAVALDGNVEATRRLCSQDEHFNSTPMGLAATVMIDLESMDFDLAIADARRLAQTGPDGEDARRRLLQGIQIYDQRRPGHPGPYCVASMLLAADGRAEAAAMSLELCSQRCQDDTCREVVVALKRELLPANTPPP